MPGGRGTQRRGVICMAVHLPSISITFRQLAGTFIQRSAVGWR